MWCTLIKQGEMKFLGKMSFWYHYNKHTFSFNLTPKSSSYSYYFFDIRAFVYKAVSSFSRSVILKSRSLKFPIPIVRIWQAAENAELLVRKYLKISQKLHGGENSQNRHELFSPCQLQLSKSQNRPVWLVPCFFFWSKSHTWQVITTCNSIYSDY